MFQKKKKKATGSHTKAQRSKKLNHRRIKSSIPNYYETNINFVGANMKFIANEISKKTHKKIITIMNNKVLKVNR